MSKKIKQDIKSDEIVPSYDILSSFISYEGVVGHQINSMNWFYKEILPFIITKENNVIQTRNLEGTCHRLTFHNMNITKPSVKEKEGTIHYVNPFECRIRSLTYACSCFIDVTHEILDKNDEPVQVKEYRNIMLLKMPCMLMSDLCHLKDMNPKSINTECIKDTGGYFIINGVEKVILSQEKLRTNTMFLFEDKKLNRHSHVCEIRSCHETKKRSTSTLYTKIRLVKGHMTKDSISVSVPFVEKPILYKYILKILGVDEKWKVCRIIAPDMDTLISEDPELAHMLQDTIDNGLCTDSIDEIFTMISVMHDDGRDRQKDNVDKYYMHIFRNEFLPHISIDDTPEAWISKSVFFGKIIRNLVEVVIGKRKMDDRDHYANKRIDTSGMLFSLLFRQIFRNFCKQITMALHRQIEANKSINVLELINSKRITARIKYAMSTGNWQANKGGINSQIGVVQMLTRMTMVAGIANMRRISTPINKESKSIGPRQLHTSSWGVICPTETPEGASCGLIKNLAMTAVIRISKYNNLIRKWLSSREYMVKVVDTFYENCRLKKIRVYFEGVIIGYIDDASCMISEIQDKKKSGYLPIYMSVYYDSLNCELIISNDNGCLMRPVICIERVGEIKECYEHTKNCTPGTFWKKLLAEGIVEYIDKDQENNTRIALKYNEYLHNPPNTFTHLEIHPSVILGLCASLIPFSNFNQAPRNTYQSAMGKQSIGFCLSNMNYRMDTIAYSLCYPEKPIVATWMENILKTEHVSAGSNPIVAIACYLGYNQEDSIIINQGALDRGLFRCNVYHTYKDEIRCSGTDEQIFTKPNEKTTSSMKLANYDKLQSNGLPRIGENIENGDIILGKTVSTRDITGSDADSNKQIHHCQSTVVRHIESSKIDMICKSRNKNGNTCIKIRTNSFRTPEIGDKFTSRHGQKGVCGIVLPHEDMPYSSEGIVPDIIINPHCIPSRMTIAHLFEALSSRVACMKGETRDGTAFNNHTIESVAQELHEFGYNRHGNETMCNGMTGAIMPGQIFLAPVHYQKLRHMVLDKRHSRTRGPKTLLTRQPVEGRSREGGLRFGEMERDCVISHGAAQFLKERLFEVSDAFEVCVCGKCGNFAQKTETLQEDVQKYCRKCQTHENIHELKMPYAFKLLLQEINSMGIKTQLCIN